VLTITIDWLAVNFKEYTHAAEQFMRTYASFPPTQDTTPRFGYSVATLDDNGSVIQWNPDRPDMGHHVIFSGTALRNIFSRTTIQHGTLLRTCIDAGGNISRLDLAKDLTETPIDLSAIYQSIEQGGGRGPVRKYSRVTSNDNGYTIYIGSRQSERYIRIYDKAAEQGIVDKDWKRLECETKGVVARSVALALSNTIDWSHVFDNVVRGSIWLPRCADWLAFFPAGMVPIGLPKETKITDREAWILGQVIGAVAKHYIENPNSEAVARLLSTLNLIDRQRKE
jgi:Replication initiation factor